MVIGNYRLLGYVWRTVFHRQRQVLNSEEYQIETICFKWKTKKSSECKLPRFLISMLNKIAKIQTNSRSDDKSPSIFWNSAIIIWDSINNLWWPFKQINEIDSKFKQNVIIIVRLVITNILIIYQANELI